MPAISLMSAPAANTWGPPVITTAATSARSAASVASSPIRRCMAASRAFIFGRSSRSTPTPSATSRWTVSSPSGFEASFMTRTLRRAPTRYRTSSESRGDCLDKACTGTGAIRGTMVQPFDPTGCGRARSTSADRPDPRRPPREKMSTASTHLPTPDAQLRLGAFIEGGGTTFRLWAPRATRVELALVGEDRDQVNYDLEPIDGGCWHVHVAGVGPEQRYGYRVHGEWAPARGRPVQPGQAAARPVRPRHHQRGRLLGPDPRPHPRLRLRARPPRLFHRRSRSAWWWRTPRGRGRSPGRCRWPARCSTSCTSRATPSCTPPYPSTCAAPTPAWPTRP